MDWIVAESCPIPKSKTELNVIATMEFNWLDCPDLTQTEAIDQPAIGTRDLLAVSFDAGHKLSGKAADDDDSLAAARASIANMADSNTAPPSTSAAIQGSSKLAPSNVDTNDLASMADTVASIAGTVDSNAAPPAASTAIQGFSKLAPVNVDANDLASMADTDYAALIYVR